MRVRTLVGYQREVECIPTAPAFILNPVIYNKPSGHGEIAKIKLRLKQKVRALSRRVDLGCVVLLGREDSDML